MVKRKGIKERYKYVWRLVRVSNGEVVAHRWFWSEATVFYHPSVTFTHSATPMRVYHGNAKKIIRNEVKRILTQLGENISTFYRCAKWTRHSTYIQDFSHRLKVFGWGGKPGFIVKLTVYSVSNAPMDSVCAMRYGNEKVKTVEYACPQITEDTSGII